MKLPAYPEYKDSGVPWLGKIPSNWSTIKTKYLFDERVQKGFPGEPLLAATQTQGVVKKTRYATRTVVAQKDLHLLKLVNQGDFVISLRSFQGGIEYAHDRGIISPAYTIMIPRGRIDCDYYKHLAKSNVFIALLTTCVTGIREGQNVDYEVLKKIKMPVPSSAEQTQIARFLDWKMAQINRFIRNKKRLIELLKEQKQNIINQAVTKGLNPQAPMKPSGVPWLGDTPAHWDVVAVRRCAKLVKTGGTPQGADQRFFAEDGFNWYTPGDFTEDIVLGESARMLSVEGKNAVRSFPIGTVMMVGIGATIGKVAICFRESSCNQQINGIVVDERIDCHFFAYSLRRLRQYFIRCGNFTTMPIINQDETKSLKLAIPTIGEQKQIVSWIVTNVGLIDVAISRAEREIELVREYRTRLISDVVTGQVDVRGIAVPDVAPEDLSEPVDDSVDEEDLAELNPEEAPVEA